MLFTTFESVLRTIQDEELPGGDVPQVLIYNSGLDAWAALNLGRDADKVQFFDDPRNIAVCIITTSDVRSLGKGFDLAAAPGQFFSLFDETIPRPFQTPFSSFFKPTPAPDDTVH